MRNIFTLFVILIILLGCEKKLTKEERDAILLTDVFAVLKEAEDRKILSEMLSWEKSIPNNDELFHWEKYYSKAEIDSMAIRIADLSKFSTNSKYHYNSRHVQTFLNEKNGIYLIDSLEKTINSQAELIKNLIEKSNSRKKLEIKKPKIINENNSKKDQPVLTENKNNFQKVEQYQLQNTEEVDVPASFSFIKDCYGVPNNPLGLTLFRPKVVYILTKNYTENSKIDGAELKKSMIQQLRNFKNSSDNANYLTVVYITELPSWPSDSDLDCDKDGPVFSSRNKEGKTIYLCELKYSTRQSCAKVRRWYGAISKLVDASGNNFDGQEICY